MNESAATLVSPELPPRFRALSGEFEDPAVELDFRTARLERDGRQLASVLRFGGVLFPVFGITDYPHLGFTTTAVLLTALQCVVAAAALGVAHLVAANPARSLRARYVTSVEVLAMAVFLVVTAVTANQLNTRNLEFAVLVLALFVFIPNRLVPVGVVLGLSTVAYCVVGLTTPAGSPRVSVEVIMTLVTIVCIGAWTAGLLARSRREEYSLLLQERRSRERLEIEMHERAVLQDELEWMANHDALTDLLNRRSFFELAEHEFAKGRRIGRPVSVLVIDADEFKNINDAFGHHTGDEAIKAIAQQAKLSLRTDDVVGRLGGEEFAVVMGGAPIGLAHDIAGRLRQRISEVVIDHPDGDVTLTVSIGVTECRLWQETVQEALHRADAAMYEAKVQGRDRVVQV